MPLRTKEISQEMYRRIYRLMKRNVKAHTIAATLNLPVKTVLGVVNRIERNDSATGTAQINNNMESSESQEYLDVYFYPKTRYAILDLVGILSESSLDKLRAELEKMVTSSWKAVAVRMSDVTLLSQSTANVIIEYQKKFTTLGRYIGILDPAPAIEPSLLEFGIEPALPIFGTESAFEDAAFSKKAKSYTRRGSQNS